MPSIASVHGHEANHPHWRIAQSHEKNGHGHHMSKPDGGGMKKHNGMMKSQEAG